MRSPSGLAENSGNVWRRIILTRGRTEDSGGAVFALAVFALAVFAPAVFSGREQRTEFLVEMLTNKNFVTTDDDIISVPH